MGKGPSKSCFQVGAPHTRALEKASDSKRTEQEIDATAAGASGLIDAAIANANAMKDKIPKPDESGSVKLTHGPDIFSIFYN